MAADRPTHRAAGRAAGRGQAQATARSQRGVVLIALLLMLMLVGIGALSAAEVWATTRKHEREVELLWVGEQYRHAIESYWKATPGARKIMPSTLEQLLVDDRFPNQVHHLRAVYPDPMAEDAPFELIRVNNALVGVRSTSKDKPMKHAWFPRRYARFALAEDYSQWEFVFVPPVMLMTPGVPLAPGPQPGTPQPNLPPGLPQLPHRN